MSRGKANRKQNFCFALLKTKFFVLKLLWVQFWKKYLSFRKHHRNLAQ
jgi:hypothetical protein